MSDYVHIKALRYKPTEEDIDKIGAEIEAWKSLYPDQAMRYSYIESKKDWFDYLEFIKFPGLFKEKDNKFNRGFGTTEGYLDFVLYEDYGEECGDWYRARYTTKKEQDRYRMAFEKFFPGLDMNRVHLVDFCWYNCCEPCNCWDVEADDFYKEV